MLLILVNDGATAAVASTRFELFDQQDATFCMANLGQAPRDLLAK